jgi:hypothetical protein
MAVIAIIITIMVLELKVPHGATLDMLLPLAPVLLSYVLSFIYVGIYWNKLQYAKYPSTKSKLRVPPVAPCAHRQYDEPAANGLLGVKRWPIGIK